jgi:transcriptional regulator with XRE-family HTH domain
MLLQSSNDANIAKGMDQQIIIAEIEARAKALGLAMSEVCRRANIHPTTFSRWKLSDKNPDPIGATIKSLSALSDILDAAERSAPTDAAA